MKTAVYPLPMDEELTGQVRQMAKSHGMSMANVMRQSIKLGLPKLHEALATKDGRVTTVDPLSEETWRAVYAKPDEDRELIDAMIAKQSWGVEE